jgi:hypothetical protein
MSCPPQCSLLGLRTLGGCSGGSRSMSCIKLGPLTFGNRSKSNDYDGKGIEKIGRWPPHRDEFALTLLARNKSRLALSCDCLSSVECAPGAVLDGQVLLPLKVWSNLVSRFPMPFPQNDFGEGATTVGADARAMSGVGRCKKMSSCSAACAACH